MRRLAPAVLALALALSACGSEPEPQVQPSPSQTPSPTPTPTLPTVAADKANAKKALVTPADLGSPWLKPKTVNRTKNDEGEMCPGQKRAAVLAPARGEALHRLTKGGKAGAPIGSFGVRAYAFGEEQAWRDAIAAAAKGCATWNAKEGTYVTLEVVTPPVVVSADEVHAHVERIYADKTKKDLYYVRHYYEARSGRIVTSFEYAYVPPKSDPTGADLGVSQLLLEQQVAKARTTFGRPGVP